MRESFPISFDRFVRDEEEDEKLNVKKPSKEDYGKVLAKKYYDKLYKEYAIVDLSRYETNQYNHENIKGTNI